MDGTSSRPKHIFGPVPSRRLGSSLGVDLVPYKTCSFDCIYCDLGRTTHKTADRESFVNATEIKVELEKVLPSLKRPPDYITLSGSGEPTLNREIGEIIRSIKEMTSVPLAVLTNGSLLFIGEVRDHLLDADVVLPSLDAVTPITFRTMNRPHGSLQIDKIISGLVDFRKEYRGQIWLEIVFCKAINDWKEEVAKLREVVEEVEPDRIQLNTPVRPPAEDFASPLSWEDLEVVKNRFGEKAEIISETTIPMGESSDSAKDGEILNLLRRRPCTAEDVSKALNLRIDDVVKYLDCLRRTGTVRYRVFQHRCYFEIALTHQKGRADFSKVYGKSFQEPKDVRSFRKDGK